MIKKLTFRTAYGMDVHSNNTFRNIPKVTFNDVKEGRIKETKVSYCTQVLSRAMSRHMSILVNYTGKEALSYPTLGFSYKV